LVLGWTAAELAGPDGVVAVAVPQAAVVSTAATRTMADSFEFMRVMLPGRA
jgi:hypothetical protein